MRIQIPEKKVFIMEYNTQQPPLTLPGYGRSIQRMVDYAVTIDDRAERQRCAETIIRIMKGKFPEGQDMPDYEHKLWDHLAIMADFKLDIDYPFEVIQPENFRPRPDTVPYGSGRIAQRHYGHYILAMIDEARQLPDGPLRDELVRLIAIQMKKEHLLWNKEGLEDGKILEDIRTLSEGEIVANEKAVNLGAYKLPATMQVQPAQSQGKKKKKKKKNNNNNNNN